eukprot:5793208-Prymnesium_polylepis.1
MKRECNTQHTVLPCLVPVARQRECESVAQRARQSKAVRREVAASRAERRMLSHPAPNCRIVCRSARALGRWCVAPLSLQSLPPRSAAMG